MKSDLVEVFLSGLGFSHQADAPAKPAKEEKKISNDNDLAAHGIMINAPKEEKPGKGRTY